MFNLEKYQNLIGRTSMLEQCSNMSKMEIKRLKQFNLPTVHSLKENLRSTMNLIIGKKLVSAHCKKLKIINLFITALKVLGPQICSME
jgi:hypothetical protein